MLDEESIDRLTDAEVLRERSDGRFAVTGAIQSELDEVRQQIEAGGWGHVREAVQTVCASDDQSEQVLAALDDRTARGARFLVIQSATEFTVPECLQLTYLLEEFDREPPPDTGVPGGFHAIHGDQVPLVMTVTAKAILYVWKSNCDPCDTMYEEFDSIFGEAEDGELGLYAVYGPDASEFLYDRYNVVGAPTTLFFLNGAVDSRLQGPHYRSVITSEIETLREVPA